MTTLAKATVIGNLLNDPIVRFNPNNGDPIVTLRLGVNDSRAKKGDGGDVVRDENGNVVYEERDLLVYTVTLFGDYGMRKAKAYNKGDRLYAEARNPYPRHYIGKDEKIYTELVMDKDAEVKQLAKGQISRGTGTKEPVSNEKLAELAASSIGNDEAPETNSAPAEAQAQTGAETQGETQKEGELAKVG